jgi:hypothetical protein
MDASSISNRLNRDDGSLLGAYGKRLSTSITLLTVFKNKIIFSFFLHDIQILLKIEEDSKEEEVVLFDIIVKVEY